MRSITLTTLLLALLFSGGCSLHDVKEMPEPVVPADPQAGLQWPVEEMAADAWWLQFGDKTLNGLVVESLEVNLSVGQAVLRIERAQAILKQTRSLYKPQLDAVVSGGGTWDQDGGADPILSAGGVLTWELDLFARLRSQARARERELAATAHDLAGVRLFITGQVVDAYYQALEQHLQLALLEEQIELARNLLELTELRFAQGAASAVDVLQQRSQLTETLAEVPRAKALLRAFENQLDVLLARSPDRQARVSVAESALPGATGLPAVSVPANLLVSRPDIQRLRDLLVADDHRIAEAIANRLPRITLTGDFAYQETPGLSGLASAAAASLVQPLIDWGRRAALVEEARALHAESLLRFSEAYLQAIEEVDTTLWQEAKQRELIATLEERRQILEINVREARHRYIQGLTDYLPVLTAVRELQQVERRLLTERRTLVTFRVRLHRATGGPMPEPEIAGSDNEEPL